MKTNFHFLQEVCFNSNAHEAEVVLVETVGSGGVVPLIHNLCTKWRWVASFTRWPLYLPKKSPHTCWIECWVGPIAGLDSLEKKISFPSRESNHDPSVGPTLKLIIIPSSADYLIIWILIYFCYITIAQPKWTCVVCGSHYFGGRMSPTVHFKCSHRLRNGTVRYEGGCFRWQCW